MSGSKDLLPCWSQVLSVPRAKDAKKLQEMTKKMEAGKLITFYFQSKIKRWKEKNISLSLIQDTTEEVKNGNKGFTFLKLAPVYLCSDPQFLNQNSTFPLYL